LIPPPKVNTVGIQIEMSNFGTATKNLELKMKKEETPGSTSFVQYDIDQLIAEVRPR
jgi:hypothetical protein